MRLACQCVASVLSAYVLTVAQLSLRELFKYVLSTTSCKTMLCYLSAGVLHIMCAHAQACTLVPVRTHQSICVCWWRCVYLTTPSLGQNKCVWSAILQLTTSCFGRWTEGSCRAVAYLLYFPLHVRFFDWGMDNFSLFARHPSGRERVGYARYVQVGKRKMATALRWMNMCRLEGRTG